MWLLLTVAVAAINYHRETQNALHGALSAAALRVPVNALALVALAYGSINPFHKQINCYWAGGLGWLLALLTDQPAMAFYGSGYVASLMQGVAHELTGERANLPELAMRTGPEKAGDEHAHTAFFPCLILHSLHESLSEWAAAGNRDGKRL